MNRFDLAIAPRALQITGAADRETRQIADLWVAMFGADAAWHVARKIDDLSAWGDQTGVSAMRRVLANRAGWLQLELVGHQRPDLLLVNVPQYRLRRGQLQGVEGSLQLVLQLGGDRQGAAGIIATRTTRRRTTRGAAAASHRSAGG